MKILLGIIILFMQSLPFPGPGGVSNAGVTMTVVQHPKNTSCGGTGTCIVTTSATTAGNLLLVISAAYSPTLRTYTLASGDGTWTHCPASATSVLSGATHLYADCAYILSATGGATAITWTWNSTVSAQNVEVIEVSRSSGSWVYDTGGTNTSAGCSSCTAVALSLSGTNDYITQFGELNSTPSAISSPYTSPADFTAIGALFAGAKQTSSGTAPTVTQGSSTQASFGAAAFK
jgi:hypothetical protein